MYGNITSQIDLTLLAFNLFFLFFVGLVAYLHRESKREGYPLVNADHQPVGGGLFGMPGPKTYHLADGTTMVAPHDRDAVARTWAADIKPGSANMPLTPSGASLGDNIGPGAWTERRDIVDVNFEGKQRIQPMRVASHYSIAAQDTQLIGLPLYGADGAKAGAVRDIWIDIAETMIRYVEVTLDGAFTGGPRHVLVPINMIDLTKAGWGHDASLTVDAITAGQFAGVPTTKSADAVTLREEDRIMGYYGAGYLYATPSRQEPLV